MNAADAQAALQMAEPLYQSVDEEIQAYLAKSKK
jgi:hypothetical protein